MNSMLRLHNPQQAWTALNRLWPDIKAWTMAGNALDLEVRPSRRGEDQSRKFHAICNDLALSGLPWFGKPRDAAAWKVLLVSGHAVATKQGAEVIPGIEGEFVNIRESTARMSKSRASSLIEYAVAFCAQHGVELSEPVEVSQ